MHISLLVCCAKMLPLYSGLVPLHNACSYGHYEVTQLLIEVCACLVFNIFLSESNKVFRNNFLLFNCCPLSHTGPSELNAK